MIEPTLGTSIGAVLGLAFVGVVVWLVLVGVVTWIQRQEGAKGPAAVLLALWVVLSML